MKHHRTTKRTPPAAARYLRRMRALRVLRWPRWPNDHAQHLIAVRQIGDALSDPSIGVARMARVGVSFTRWQKWRVRWAMWLGKPGWAQRIILAQLRKD